MLSQVLLQTSRNFCKIQKNLCRVRKYNSVQTNLDLFNLNDEELIDPRAWSSRSAECPGLSTEPEQILNSRVWNQAGSLFSNNWGPSTEEVFVWRQRLIPWRITLKSTEPMGIQMDGQELQTAGKVKCWISCKDERNVRKFKLRGRWTSVFPHRNFDKANYATVPDHVFYQKEIHWFGF